MTNVKIDQKVYSQSLDDGFGKVAELAVIQFLQNMQDVVHVDHYPHGEKDVDIKAWLDPRTGYYIDVERRENWVWPQMFFPFPAVHVPWRKRRMILNRQPFVYFVVRSDCKRMASLPGSIIMDSEILRSKNKYDNAKFYNVPIEHLRYWDLELKNEE